MPLTYVKKIQRTKSESRERYRGSSVRGLDGASYKQNVVLFCEELTSVGGKAARTRGHRASMFSP